MSKLIALICATVTTASFSVSAALMKFSFEGHITDVENTKDVYWEPISTLGASISGYMIMDTELALGGREEVSYYWWHNIDSDPGALSTHFELGGDTYTLSSEYDYNAMYDSYVTNEFLEYGGGIDESGLPIPDNMGLRDTEQQEYITANTEVFSDKKFAFGISDTNSNFLTDFRPVPGQSEPQPDWLQEYVWTNDGTDNGRSGGGSYRYYYATTDLATNSTTAIDSTLKFRFSKVSAQRIIDVPAPTTFWLILFTFIGFIARSSLRNRGHHALAFRSTKYI
ncbi:hypothetical protein [uncultured Paraglaciecola sp.]|uniref:hypothetical protein n=1 Tax=uncultured Paraglaciecola sp. TaxID=1765024 RepID=UPI0030D7FB99|tara:strand:- start:633 stop:1478 length:846 start_codon:yes stop_codon:yes gene_type:complete